MARLVQPHERTSLNGPGRSSVELPFTDAFRVHVRATPDGSYEFAWQDFQHARRHLRMAAFEDRSNGGLVRRFSSSLRHAPVDRGEGDGLRPPRWVLAPGEEGADGPAIQL